MADPLRLSFDLPFQDAIAAAAARRVVLPDEYYGQVPASVRRISTTVSGLAGLDQISAVIASYRDAAAKGEAFADWKLRAERAGWSLPNGRLETIFRTNIQTEYSAGHWRSFEERTTRRPYLMYSAINDSRVRPAHLAMDGYIAPINDPIWRSWTPPCGFNCRCSQISLTHDQAVARGYGRQAQPNAQPDPGFAERQPGKPEAAIARILVQKATETPPVLRQGLEQIVAAKPIGPRGRPVSEALGLPTAKGVTQTAMRETARIIDELQGDGELPRIPVLTTNGKNQLGRYSYHRDGTPAEVGVSRLGDHPRLTFAHEIGHFLDHHGWGGAGFSSEVEAAAQAWREAVAASPSITRLQDLAGTSGQARYVRYLLTLRETWARSYAQWVATRSADARMLSDVAKIRTQYPTEAGRLSQWGALEFEPIAKAIDDLFALLGWRH